MLSVGYSMFIGFYIRKGFRIYNTLPGRKPILGF